MYYKIGQGGSPGAGCGQTLLSEKGQKEKADEIQLHAHKINATFKGFTEQKETESDFPNYQVFFVCFVHAVDNATLKFNMW